MCVRCGYLGHSASTCAVDPSRYRWGANGYEKPPRVSEIDTNDSNSQNDTIGTIDFDHLF